MRSWVISCAVLLVVSTGVASQPAGSQPAGSAAAPAAEPRHFAVEITTGPGWDLAKAPGEQRLFREHSLHLKKLRDAGHIVLGARYSDKGLLVFAAQTAAEVKALMDQDPSMAAGTFKFEVYDFNVFYSGTLQTRPRR